ncbi:hypothetical protein ACLMJK_007781 [Lecanora helva]
MYGAHYDIVAGLPPEIVATIFHYLPLHQVFSARRVSSSWSWKLSSVQLIDGLLKSWFPNDQVSLRIPEGLSSQAVPALKAEHVDAYRNGNPFSTSTLPTPGISYPDMYAVAYRDGVLAWLTFQCIEMRIYWIESGEQITRTIDGAYRPSEIAVTSQLVCIRTGTDKFQVWKLPSMEMMEPWSLKPSQDRINSLDASGTTLAILYDLSARAPEVDMAIWDVDDEPIHLKARIQEEFALTDVQIMADDASKSVILLERAQIGGSAFFTRFDTKGSVLAKGSINNLYDSLYIRSHLPMPINVNGSATVWILYKEHSPHYPEYDTSRPALSIRRVFFNLTKNEFSLATARICTEAEDRMFIIYLVWKDCVYCQDSGSIWYIIDLKERKIEPVHLGRFSRCTESHWKILYGDETYIIWAHNDEIKIWNFDKNIKIANQDWERPSEFSKFKNHDRDK